MVGTETGIDPEISDIVADSVGGRRLTENECVRLMGCPEDSPEGRLIMRSADAIARRLCGNIASIGVQIGVITGPCVANCGFCSFAMSTTKADDNVMPPDVLEGYLREAVDSGIVDSVSLMTIHNIELDDLLDAVATAKAILPEDIDLCVNTGDLTFGEMLELRDAGISKAYHALRIGEGDDTRLNPLDRFNTVRNFVRAGIDVVTCVEPIGPEHADMEIVRLFHSARESGCSRCSAARRLDVPGERGCTVWARSRLGVWISSGPSYCCRRAGTASTAAITAVSGRTSQSMPEVRRTTPTTQKPATGTPCRQFPPDSARPDMSSVRIPPEGFFPSSVDSDPSRSLKSGG